MDSYLIFYCVLTAINIAVLLAIFYFSNKKTDLISLINFIMIIVAIIFIVLIPIKQEIQLINDCIYFYSEYRITENYNFSFLDRCNFKENQIENIISSKKKIEPSGIKLEFNMSVNGP